MIHPRHPPICRPRIVILVANHPHSISPEVVGLAKSVSQSAAHSRPFLVHHQHKSWPVGFGFALPRPKGNTQAPQQTEKMHTIVPETPPTFAAFEMFLLGLTAFLPFLCFSNGTHDAFC